MIDHFCELSSNFLSVNSAFGACVQSNFKSISNGCSFISEVTESNFDVLLGHEVDFSDFDLVVEERSGVGISFDFGVLVRDVTVSSSNFDLGRTDVFMQVFDGATTSIELCELLGTCSILLVVEEFVRFRVSSSSCVGESTISNEASLDLSLLGLVTRLTLVSHVFSKLFESL